MATFSGLSANDLTDVLVMAVSEGVISGEEAIHDWLQSAHLHGTRIKPKHVTAIYRATRGEGVRANKGRK